MAYDSPASTTSSSAEQAVPGAPEIDRPPLNADTIRSLGTKLASEFASYEKDRRQAEMRWAQNLRQFLGKYDDVVDKQIPLDKSRAYPKLTRTKCVSTVARLMNLLFPSTEMNWGIDASPVPNLSEEDLNSVLESLQQDPEAEITDETITNAVREFARVRAVNLQMEIADQLTEIGGAKTVNYIALCKKVLMSGVMYGMGVLKGPMTRARMQRRWHLSPETNKVVAINEPVLLPQFEFCPLWDTTPT